MKNKIISFVIVVTLSIFVIFTNFDRQPETIKQPYKPTKTDLYNYTIHCKRQAFRANFRQAINELKIREGFSPVVYDDKGWACVGYGQRLAFYPEPIPVPLTEAQADIILRKSFMRHIKLVKKVYPGITGIKLIRYSYQSYIGGIARLKEITK